jgi:hypothetical protein
VTTTGARLLFLAGLGSAAVSLLHVAIVAIGAPAYRFFGAGERMARMAERGIPEPTLITIALAALFAVWSAYGFSGAGLVRPLPFLAKGLLLIGLVYTGRGLALLPQLALVVGLAGAVPLRHLLFSASSLAIGLLYVAGVIREWPALTARMP